MNTPEWEWLIETAARVVGDVISELPPDIQHRVRDLPINYQKQPGKALRSEGIDADTLGLFQGPSFPDDTGVDPMPHQILLFLENIWDMVEGDSLEFEDEVRTTLLHEIGHYLGLDEDGLEDRGLD